MNSVLVEGRVIGKLIPSHRYKSLDNKSKSIYLAYLEVRYPKSKSTITLFIPDNVRTIIKDGDYIRVSGYLTYSRSNKKPDLAVVAKEIERINKCPIDEDGQDVNDVAILGEVINSYDLRDVGNSKFKVFILKQVFEDGTYLTVKVISWNRLAKYAEDNIKIGDSYIVTGRLESREFKYGSPKSDKVINLHEVLAKSIVRYK